MSERLVRINRLAEPIVDSLGLTSTLGKRCLINAIDAATSPERGCGARCLDCRTLGSITGTEVKVCDILEGQDQDVAVYREHTRSAIPRTYGELDGGAYY